MTALDAILLAAPIVAILLGLGLLLLPRRYRLSAERRHSGRLAELEAGADERFLEERRALEAYRPLASDSAVRLIGAILIATGAFQLLDIGP